MNWNDAKIKLALGEKVSNGPMGKDSAYLCMRDGSILRVNSDEEVIHGWMPSLSEKVTDDWKIIT